MKGSGVRKLHIMMLLNDSNVCLFQANLIVLNLVLAFIFVLYFIFTLLVLIGISRVSERIDFN